MTIASALTAMNTDIVNARTAITNKGGTVTSGGGSSQLATDIATIPSGGSAPVITSLNVTPTTSAQTITAPSGTDGYSPVNVAAVTAAIDSDIKASNIKSGVSILGVTGNVVELNGETRTETLTSSAGNTFTPSSGKNGITSITVTPNNEARSVTPSTSAQTLSVNSGYSGNGTISVSAVTSSIDANITAGNIKKDVTILGVTGTYEGSGGGGDSGAGRVFNANFWVDTSGVVNNFKNPNNQTVSATATVINESELYRAYINDTTILKCDLSNIVEIKRQGLYQAFQGCSNITSVDFLNLQIARDYAMGATFTRTSISEVDFWNLETLTGNSPCTGLFWQQKTDITVKFHKLSDITNATNPFDRLFMRMTTKPTVYFYALKTTSLNSSSFYNMFSNVTGGVMHLPSNLQSVVSTLTGYPLFSGTNTVLAFDLPATS